MERETILSGEEVKVFGAWGSPMSHRVELALKLKGVDYQYIEEDLINNNKSPLLLKYNPVHKKVPVLLHNGKPIAESLVILEYIDQIWTSNPILPHDPYDKAMARFWAKFIDDKCLPAVWGAALSLGKEEKEREKVVEEACECLKTLDGVLKLNAGKRFFGGDCIGLVDIAANFLGYWLDIIQEATGLELLSAEKFPDLFKWSQDFASCTVVKESLLPIPRERLLSVAKARIAAASAAAMEQPQTTAPN